MKACREGSVVVLPRNERIVDVFRDKGWTTHSTFEVTSDNGLKLVKGPAISEGEFRFVGRVMLGKNFGQKQ